jgi:hypothetical protein
MKLKRKPALLKAGYRFLQSLGLFKLRSRYGVKQAQLTVEMVDEKPDAPQEDVLYLIGENDDLWAAQMHCPCGCGEMIDLNLMDSIRPRWTVVEEWDGTFSLSPSVWRRRGCQSHFFVKRSEILWC